MVKQILLTLLLILFLARPSRCRSPHVIQFRWPDLYPGSLSWDPKADHFVLGSLRHRHLVSVSDAGVASTLLSDDSLPPNSSFLGVSLDLRRRRLLAVVRCSTPHLSALAAYDLPTSHRLFLAPLDGLLPSPAAAKDVAVDYAGNAYVTDSANDAIYRVTEQGEVTILSRSHAFRSDSGSQDGGGLNGVVYNSKGYLLVTQSSTGKLFKVNADDGTARRVILNKDLTDGGGIASRRDGVVVVFSKQRLYFVKSDDSWGEGVVFDETAVEEAGHASGVAVAAEDRVYVAYGLSGEGITANSELSIVEVRSGVEDKEENVWIFILLGLGLAYFCYWRFQMKQLVQNMDKKTS